MQRQGWADAARGLAIITVVFFHVVLAMGDVGPVHWIAWLLINLFSPFPIVLFFVAAGRFTQTLVERGWTGGVTRRIVGLFYVFGLWSLLQFAVSSALLGTHRIDVTSYLADPRSPLWFIWALALYTGVAAATPRTLRVTVVTAAAVVSLGSFAGVVTFDSFVYDNLLRFLPFFLTGVAAGAIEIRIERRRWILLFAGAVLFVILTSLTFWPQTAPALRGALLFSLAGVAVPMGIAGASIVAGAPGMGALIKQFGRLSLGVYLVHPAVIPFIVRSSQAFSLDHAFAEPALSFIMTALVLGLSIAFVALSQSFKWYWLYRPPAFAAAPAPGGFAPSPLAVPLDAGLKPSANSRLTGQRSSGQRGRDEA